MCTRWVNWGHMCCAMLHIVLAPYRLRPQHVGSARSELECMQHVSKEWRDMCSIMGGIWGTCVVQCRTSFRHCTHVVPDVLGVQGVHWNAHNSSPKSVYTCTQHGCPGGYMCCTVVHVVLAPYTLRPRRIGSARGAVECTELVSEECGDMHST